MDTPPTRDEFRRARATQFARTLTGAEYTSPAVFAAEVERLFRPGWMCIGRAELVRAPESVAVVDVVGENLLVTRDRSGRVHAFHNTCRHRGTTLCVGGAQGASNIRCPYHSWTYALDGRLLVAPNMGEVAGFDPAEHGLHRVGLAEWNGFLFVNLDGQARPFLDEYPCLADKFAEWTLPALRAGHEAHYDVRANWKQICENYSECYHCPPVHPQLARLSPATSGRNDLDDGPVLGGYSTFCAGVQTLTMSGQTRRPCLPELSPDSQARVYFYVIFPNLLLSLHPDYVLCHVLSPVAAGHTRVDCTWLFASEVEGASGFDPTDAVEFWDLTNRQDWEMCERTYQGTKSRAYVPGPYSHAEGLLDAFDREYRRRVENAASPHCG